MPRTYKKKTDRQYRKTDKPQALPAKFKPGFLASLDQRTMLAQYLRANYAEIMADLGGEENVSRVKRTLAERYVWLEAFLQTLEDQMTSGDVPAEEALGRYVRCTQTLNALSKQLGLDKAPRVRPWVETTAQSNGSN